MHGGAGHNQKTLAYYYANRSRLLPQRRQRARAKQIALAGYLATACEICGRSTDKPLHWDHNHATGQFRGWLCETCNKGLGLFKDSPDLLVSAVAYLRQRGHEGPDTRP